MISKRQGIIISAPEEIAYFNGWIDQEKRLESAVRYGYTHKEHITIEV